MLVEEKIRSLINTRLREIHGNIAGTLSMGDLAVYVGQPMQDAMNELAEFIQQQERQTIEIMDGALKIAADLAAALKPLIPGPENLEPEQRAQWQKVINAIYAASDYAERHDLKQWGGKQNGPQLVT